MKRSNLFTAILLIIITAAMGFGQETQPAEAPASTAEVPGGDGAVTAKPAGTIRIGLIMPKIQVGAEASSPEAAAAVRDSLSSFLKGPTVDVVIIEARSPTNASVEAAQKSCDFILFTSISRKTKTSLFGSLIKAAVPVVAGQIPGNAANSPTTSGMSDVKQAAADGGKDYLNNAVAVKFGARDEVALEFNLADTATRSTVAKGSANAKVTADGEDVIPVLIEQVAEKVLQVVVKK